jgi:hypothetical protein
MVMTRQAIATAAALAALALAGPAQAQATATTTGEARASVVRTLAMASRAPLSFGLIAADSSAFQVTLTPSGVLSSTRPGVLVPGQVSAGAFEVTGEPSRVYTVDLPSSVQLSAGEQTMTVSGLVLQFGGAEGTGGAGLLGSDGRQVFNVGGTLAVGALQAPGDYTGAYVVTARYQ